MRKTTLRRLSLVSVGLMLGAGQIVGAAPAVTPGSTIVFSGGATLNQPTDTAFTEIFGPAGTGTDPVVQFGAETGSYQLVPAGTAVPFQIFTFDPAPTTAFQLWSFTDGAATYGFDVDPGSIVANSQVVGGNYFLNITGTGMASITGYDPSPATLTISCTASGSTPTVVTFGATIAVVPEPSSLVLILGILPLALWFGFRSRAKA